MSFPVLSRVPALLLIAGLLLACETGSTAVSPEAQPSSRPAPPPTDRFGMQAARYTVETGRVGRAETFSDLLAEYGVEYRTILALADAAKPAFDVQDLRAGRPYRVYVNPWLQRPQYVVYQASAARYVVFDVQRPEQSRTATRPVERTWETVSGTVDGSLYEALVENGGHPLLALRLSEVFAWQIDFFRLRANDTFRIVYERRTIDGEPVQPGDIVAARVRHRGNDYDAFRFEGTAGEAEYYNRDGQSLRRQLLKAPLQYSRISSGFTRGTPVRSVGSGVVQFAGYDGPNGNYVKIRHNGTYASGYLHLSDIAVASGERVDQGETIGYVGSTGRSTGPHLDYRLWKHGAAVNPYTLDLPPSQPVPLQHQQAFRKTVATLLPRLRPHANTVFAQAPPAPGAGATARFRGARSYSLARSTR